MEAIQTCVDAYGVENAVVVMVVSEFEGNSYDQRFVELELNKRGTRVLRLTFE